MKQVWYKIQLLQMKTCNIVSGADLSIDYLISNLGKMNYMFSRKLKNDAKEAENAIYKNGQLQVASGSIGVVSGILGVLGKPSQSF